MTSVATIMMSAAIFTRRVRSGWLDELDGIRGEALAHPNREVAVAMGDAAPLAEIAADRSPLTALEAPLAPARRPEAATGPSHPTRVHRGRRAARAARGRFHPAGAAPLAPAGNVAPGRGGHAAVGGRACRPGRGGAGSSCRSGGARGRADHVPLPLRPSAAGGAHGPGALPSCRSQRRAAHRGGSRARPEPARGAPRPLRGRFRAPGADRTRHRAARPHHKPAGRWGIDQRAGEPPHPA